VSDRIEKDLSDLNFDDVDFDGEFKGNWSFSAGGSPHVSGEWSITYLDPVTYTETRYKLPPFLNCMIKMTSRWEKDDALRKVRNALGI